MSTVNAVAGSSQQAASDAVKKILGKDDFLKLLITQLKYQDPMEPTDNKEFIAQMAQFSSLEQMSNMSKGFEKLAAMQESTLREISVGQAVNMIGRTVTAVLPVDTVTGKLTADTGLYHGPQTGAALIKLLSKETEVTVLEQEGQTMKVMLTDGTTGYIDQAYLKLDDNPTVVGVATGMKVVNGVPYVVVNGKTIPLSLIEQVSQTEANSEQAEGGTGDNG